MAYHHICHGIYICIFCHQASNITASSENCHTVRQRFHLMHLMRNDDNGFSIISHFTKHTEQFFCLLRSQHGGRLIKDQNICSTIQYLHNFNRLFL